MCLSYVYQGKKKKEALDKLKDVITVWKVVRKNSFGHYGTTKYVTGDRKFPVHAGEGKFKQPLLGYVGGGHFFLTKEGAKGWKSCGKEYYSESGERIVQCKINKADINSIGTQYGHKIVVVKKATFPKYMGKKS